MDEIINYDDAVKTIKLAILRSQYDAAKSAIFEAEEEKWVENGETLTLTFEVTDVTNGTQDAEKKKDLAAAKPLVEEWLVSHNKAGGETYKLGMYLDLSFYKQIGSKTRTSCFYCPLRYYSSTVQVVRF